MNAYDFSGRTVVVTGGSMGIGEVFARELDARGARLVLVARSQKTLEALAAQLKNAQVIALDLARPGAAREVFDEVQRRGLEVDVLINNAGFATFGGFAETSLERQRDEVQLNVTALVELTHHFLPMLERRQGGVINVASTAAFQPTPYMAIYGATKAFVLSFSEALWAEYRGRGVRVLALCPGATKTNFFNVAGEQAAVGAKAEPEAVVQLALRSFDRNRSYVVHGFGNYLTAASSRFATRAFTAKLSARVLAGPSAGKALPTSG